MEILFFIVFLLAFYHFIWEGIILPNKRLSFRYDLFTLRDELVNLKINNPEKLDDDVFDLLFNRINVSINRLPYLTISSAWRAQIEYHSSEKFKNEFNKKRQLIVNSKIESIKRIEKDLIAIGTKAFFVNSGGWIYLLVPIMLLSSAISKLLGTANFILNKLQNQVLKLLTTSDKEFSNLSHI